MNKVWVYLSARPYIMAFEQWRRWLHWDLEQEQQRAELEQERAMLRQRHGWGLRHLCQLLGRNHGLVRRQAFGVWVEAVRQSAHEQAVFARAAYRLLQNRALRAFSRWVEHTEERQHMKFLVGFSALKLFMRANF